MGFWKTPDPTPLNPHRLTASDQKKILGELNLDKKEIQELKKSIYATTKGGHGLLNSGRRMSFDAMKEIIKAHDPKLAQELREGFEKYQKKAEEFAEEHDTGLTKESKLKANIKRTRAFDLKRERSKEYLEEMLAEKKKAAMDKERKEGRSEYHTLKAPTVSANKWARDSSGSTTSAGKRDHEVSAGKPKTKDFRELQEEAHNLPDLPI